MNIGIGLKKSAYTPDAFAYNKYLTSKGFNVQLEAECKLDLNNDINIYFMGFIPFWKKQEGKSLAIHEYQSLSTKPFSLAKDFLKQHINKTPSGRIFLNEIVYNGINIKDNVPYIYRDMGVDIELFQKISNNPIYDIVYSGSIIGRIGLIDEITRLAKIGFKILVIGEVQNSIIEHFIKYNNVFFTGRVNRDELPELYSKCKAGLNYTPNIYPFNLQTSTKTLEYLSSGLTLISNKYEWIDKFSKMENIEYLNTKDILKVDDLKSIIYNKSFEKFEWTNILKNSKIDIFLKKIYEKTRNK